jgi:hypothetical protein
MTTSSQVGERPVRYAPRSLSTQPAERVSGWTVKRYAISALRDVPPEEVLDFARRAVSLSLPDSAGRPHSHAFTVVHEDEDGCYVVVGWWSLNRLILHSRTWISTWHDLSNLVEAPAHATACVWEIAAMAFERDCWVRHVVIPEQPDVPAYLAAAITDRF